MDYIRNPRYFGRSFKRLLHQATAGFTLTPGIRDVKLSKDEKLEISGFHNVSANKEINHMLYIIGGLVSGSNARFNKEIYVVEKAEIGSYNTIQALAGDGNVTVDKGVRFLRWLDAEGDIDVNPDCNLGISASSDKMLSLKGNCFFRRIYGMPVITGPGNNDTRRVVEDNHLTPSGPLPSPSHFIRRNDSFITPGTICDDNVVFTRDVLIGSGSLFKGSIKCYGKIVLQDNVTVKGNIFADEDIIIGQNIKIDGHVFSQMSIYISEWTVISRPDKIKSVVGKKSVRIEQNVTIYGYVTTEGEGTVL